MGERKGKKGSSLRCVSGEKFGVNMEDVENWLKEFKEEYLSESKMGELVETIRVFYAIANKFLA